MVSNARGRVRGYLSTLAAGLNLAHLNMLRVALTSPRPRFRAYADAAFKLYMESTCGEVDFIELGDALQRLGLDPFRVEARLVDVGGYRGRSDWERLFLASAARACGSRPCFEIGTAAGNTTVLLADNLRGTVHTLDLPDSAQVAPALTRLGSDDVVRASRRRAEFIHRQPRENIQELLGDSASFDFSAFHDRIGLFFIDGAHSLEYVRSDTENAAWCCQRDGIIVWDDFTTSRDVTRYLRSLRSSGVALQGIRGTRLAFSRDIDRLRELSRRGPASGK
jgi:predicted O-methyltransferase YrrM